jgi:hypothetical protein
MIGLAGSRLSAASLPDFLDFAVTEFDIRRQLPACQC